MFSGRKMVLALFLVIGFAVVNAGASFATVEAVLKYKIAGVSQGGKLGKAVSSLSDCDGDGIKDFAIAGASDVWLYSGKTGKEIHREGFSTEGNLSLAGNSCLFLVGDPSLKTKRLGKDIKVGGVYLFDGKNRTLLSRKEGFTDSGLFGISVAKISRFSTDPGNYGFAVGAPREGKHGAVHVFKCDQAQKNLVYSYRINGGDSNENWGEKVVSLPDYDGDSVGDLAVKLLRAGTFYSVWIVSGSPAFDKRGKGIGLVIPFEGSVPSFGDAICHLDGAWGDKRGNSLAVGAPQAKKVFLYDSLSLDRTGEISDENTAFGIAIAGGKRRSGAAECFYAVVGSEDKINIYDKGIAIKVVVNAPVKGSKFGYSLENIGDIDGDGATEFAVGAPEENGGKGAVYVYGVKE